MDDLAPTICVVVPAYNEGRWIAETLESVLTQTRAADEIVVETTYRWDVVAARLETVLESAAK